MKKCLLLLSTLTLGLHSLESSAQIFRLQFTPDAGLNSTISDLIKEEIRKIEVDINGSLPGAETPDRLMEGMANSSVMAGKGIGTDYASGMKVFILGAGVGAGADLTKSTEPKSDISGVGVQPGIMLGTNLAWMDTQRILGLDTNKLSVFVNYLGHSLDHKTGDTDADIKMQSMGMHVSYDWITGSGSKLLGWGGVKITTGYEHNSTKLHFKSKIDKVLDYSYGGVSYNSTINATPDANVDVSTSTIPLNISSSFQFLYILSLYGGIGADYNSGSAKGRGTLNSTPSTVTCTPTGPAVCPGGQAGTVDTSANIDGDGKVTPFFFRGFAGIQINLPFTRIFVQADKAFGNNLVGATAGLRFVY